MEDSCLGAPVESFIELSVYLTGFTRFELQGTGMVVPYYEWVASHNGEEFTTLLTAFFGAQGEAPRQQAAVQSTDHTLTPLVRSIIKLWYLGQWYDPADPSQTEILSPESYQQGLVWDAILAHPQGAKQQGFGAWAMPPESLQGPVLSEATP